MDQVVAVLGEDRLGVELDAAEVRAARPGARRRSPGRPRRETPVGQRAAGAGRRTCCRSRRSPRAPPRSTRDWVPWNTMSLKASVDARAGRTAPGGRGRPPGTAARRSSSTSTAAPERGDLRVVAVARVARARARRSPGRSRRRPPASKSSWRTTDAGHAHHREDVPEHVHEVVLAVEDHRGLALELGRRRRRRPGR